MKGGLCTLTQGDFQPTDPNHLAYRTSTDVGKKRSWNTGINLLGVCSLCSAYCLLGLDLSHNVHPSSYAPWEFYHVSSPTVLLMRGIPYGLFPIPFASWTLKKQCICFCFLLFWMCTGWWLQLHFCHVILVVLVVKNPLANAGDIRVRGWTPESGRSSGVGNGNLLQYSCLKNSMDKRAWQRPQRDGHIWARHHVILWRHLGGGLRLQNTFYWYNKLCAISLSLTGISCNIIQLATKNADIPY